MIGHDIGAHVVVLRSRRFWWLPEWACPHRLIAIVSDFFGIDTAEAQALERAGMHIINIGICTRRPTATALKQARAESWARIANQNSLFGF